MTKGKWTLYIWISCGLVACSLFLSQQVLRKESHLFTMSICESEPLLTTLVLPGNHYQASAGKDYDQAVHDELALSAVKTESGTWNTPIKAIKAHAAQLPTSYLKVTSSEGTTPYKRNHTLRSVGGGQAIAMAHVSHSASHPNATIGNNGSVPMPLLTEKRVSKHSELVTPFSEEIPFNDIQRAAPGGGNGTGVTNVPVGNCPWWLLSFFVILNQIRNKKRDVA